MVLLGSVEVSSGGYRLGLAGRRGQRRSLHRVRVSQVKTTPGRERLEDGRGGCKLSARQVIKFNSDVYFGIMLEPGQCSPATIFSSRLSRIICCYLQYKTAETASLLAYIGKAPLLHFSAAVTLHISHSSKLPWVM